MICVGDDWAEDHHDVELVDQGGRRLARGRLPEGLEGVARLHELIAVQMPASWAELESAEAAGRVRVGIETDRGGWVQALVAAGYQVFAINPMSVARYRERHSTSGAKVRRRRRACAGRDPPEVPPPSAISPMTTTRRVTRSGQLVASPAAPYRPAEPFLVLAVTYVLGAIITPAARPEPAGVESRGDRLMIGAVAAGAYVLLVAICFAYFYPIYVGQALPFEAWSSRMWLGVLWMTS